MTWMKYLKAVREEVDIPEGSGIIKTLMQMYIKAVPVTEAIKRIKDK